MLVFGAATLALVAATGFGLTRFYPPPAADVVTSAEAQQREQAFANVQPLPLAPVPRDKTDAAIASMNLPAAEQDVLRKDLARGGPAGTVPKAPPAPQAAAAPARQEVRLVEIILWDTHSPDGDVVRVVSGGFTRDVLLTKSPQVVYVPADGSGSVQVLGVRDGGGGITLGVKGGDLAVLMPIMSEGQMLSLPVRAR